jgi:integration host factor subunit beta
MTKSELVLRVTELHPDLQRSDVERIVDAIFKSIGTALARGARIEIRGFGAFTLKHRSARTGRNPRTQALVEVPRRVIPAFETGKQLHASLNAEN